MQRLRTESVTKTGLKVTVQQSSAIQVQYSGSLPLKHLGSFSFKALAGMIAHSD